jgi:hypothetical protein
MNAYQQQVYSERMQGKKHKEIDIVAIILSIGMGLDSSVTAGRPVQLHVHLYMSTSKDRRGGTPRHMVAN